MNILRNPLLCVCMGLSAILITGFGGGTITLILGIALLTRGVYLYCQKFVGTEETVVTDTPPVVDKGSITTVCQHSNHAGCQDDPECPCGCHRERIAVEIKGLR